MKVLVLVPGHAICIKPHALDLTTDAAWALQPHQRGEGAYYLEHIREGVRRAAEADNRWLVFSGGYTYRQYPTQSEAESYRHVAEAQGWWDCPGVAARTLTETFARDSYENLRFALFLFRDVLHEWPAEVYVVGWAFKQQRFEWHAATLGWPRERFRYLGVNNPPDLDTAQAGEAQAFQEFLANPHGQWGRLAAKRYARNPFGRQPPAHWQARLVLGEVF